VVSGAVGGGIWAATGSPAAAGLALVVGVFMDLDHLYDFYQWYIRGRKNKVYVFFHAWEYSALGLALLGLVFYHPLFLAAVLAHLGHVASDHFHNRLSRFGYFILYRMIHKFDPAVIMPHQNVLDSYRSWPRMLPFGRRLEPWFQRRIEPWFLERVNRPAGQSED
jgi:hypothetical protein